MNDVPLIAAGSIALLAAGIHGVGGELLVVRKLSPGMLPSTRFGGPVMTKTMIHVTWHAVTISFLTIGVGLVLSGSVLDGDAARAIALVSASAFTGFAVLALGFWAATTRLPRSLLQHPGPIALAATAVLAWWGVL